MDKEINKLDIESFINTNLNNGKMSIIQELYELYNIKPATPSKYVIDNLVDYYYENLIKFQKIYFERKQKLNILKKLELPIQRSKEWYNIRNNKSK